MSKEIVIGGKALGIGHTPIIVTTNAIKRWNDAQNALNDGVDHRKYLRTVARIVRYVVRNQLEYPSMKMRIRAWTLTNRAIVRLPREVFNPMMEEIIEEITGNKKKDIETAAKANRAFLAAMEKWSESDFEKLYTALPSLLGSSPMPSDAEALMRSFSNSTSAGSDSMPSGEA